LYDSLGVSDGGLLFAVRTKDVVGDDAVFAWQLSSEQRCMARSGLRDGMRVGHLLVILAFTPQARKPAIDRQLVDALAQDPRGQLIHDNGNDDRFVLCYGRACAGQWCSGQRALGNPHIGAHDQRRDYDKVLKLHA
jgi:hypothetical protein